MTFKFGIDYVVANGYKIWSSLEAKKAYQQVDGNPFTLMIQETKSIATIAVGVTLVILIAF